MQHHQPTTLPPVAPAGAAYSLPPFSFGWPSPGPMRLQTRGTRHVAYATTIDPDSGLCMPQAHLTSICALPAFQQPAGIVKSHEELRWEDWQAGLKSQESAFPPPPACVAGPPGGVAGGGGSGGGAQQQLRRSVSAGPSSGPAAASAATTTTTVAVPFTAFADPFGVSSGAGGSSGGAGGGGINPLPSMPLTPPQFGFGFFGSGAGAGGSAAGGGATQTPPGAANPFFAVPMAGGGGAAAGAPGAAGGAPVAGPFGAPFGAAPVVQPTFGATPGPPLLTFGGGFAASAPATLTTGSPLLPPGTVDAAAPGPATPGLWTAPPQAPADVHTLGGTRHVEYERTRDLSFESLREAQYLMSISALPQFQPDANVRSHEELRWEDRQAGIRSTLDAPSPRLATPTAAAAGSEGPGAFDSAAAAAAAVVAVASLPPPAIARARPATANAATPSTRTSCFAPGRSSSGGTSAALTGPSSGGGGVLLRPPSASGPPPRRHVTFLLGGFVSSPLGTPVAARPASAITASAVAAPGMDAAAGPTSTANPFGSPAPVETPAPASAPNGHTVTTGTRPSRRSSGSGAPPQPAAPAQPALVTRAPSFGRDWLPHSESAPASAAAGVGATAASGAAGARGGIAAGTLATPYARTLDLDGGVGPSGPSYLMAMSAMPPFQPPPLGIVKSHEELRWEDRKAGVRSILSGPPRPAPQPAAADAGSAAGSAAPVSAAAGLDGGLEGQCCVCMERRAEYGFVHSCVVHLCLCSQCQDEMGRRDKLSHCLVCNEKAMSVVKVVAT